MQKHNVVVKITCHAHYWQQLNVDMKLKIETWWQLQFMKCDVLEKYAKVRKLGNQKEDIV